MKCCLEVKIINKTMMQIIDETHFTLKINEPFKSKEFQFKLIMNTLAYVNEKLHIEGLLFQVNLKLLLILHFIIKV